MKHDCLPVSCHTPPKIPHSSTDPAGAQDKEVKFAEPPVDFTCDEGYTLDGSPTGLSPLGLQNKRHKRKQK